MAIIKNSNKINVSFKNTSKELILYSYLNSLEDRSGEIKKLILAGISALNINIYTNDSEEINKSNSFKSTDDIDVTDF